MLYLVSQILVCLLFTAAIALITGWLLRGAGVRKQLQALERTCARERKRANALEERLATLQNAPASRAEPAPPLSHIMSERRREQTSNEALALRDRQTQLEGIARAQAERIAELAQRLREKEALLAGVRQHVQSAPANARRPRSDHAPPDGLLAERPNQPDRLQAITGIGPVLERVLNELGIYRFGQLARLTPDNIEWLASRIDWFPQRIQREDWVGQARRLHHEVHPDEKL